MWFVMVNATRDGRPAPLFDDDEHFTVQLFETEDAADAAGRENPLGAACGYEVYEWPDVYTT